MLFAVAAPAVERLADAVAAAYFESHVHESGFACRGFTRRQQLSTDAETLAVGFDNQEFETGCPVLEPNDGATDDTLTTAGHQNPTVVGAAALVDARFSPDRGQSGFYQTTGEA
jgi:hypothetical protein